MEVSYTISLRKQRWKAVWRLHCIGRKLEAEKTVGQWFK